MSQQFKYEAYCTAQELMELYSEGYKTQLDPATVTILTILANAVLIGVAAYVLVWGVTEIVKQFEILGESPSGQAIIVIALLAAGGYLLANLAKFKE